MNYEEMWKNLKQLITEQVNGYEIVAQHTVGRKARDLFKMRDAVDYILQDMNEMEDFENQPEGKQREYLANAFKQIKKDVAELTGNKE